MEYDPRHTSPSHDAVSWTTTGGDSGRAPGNAIKVEREFALDDLHFGGSRDVLGRPDAAEERKVSDQV